MKTEKDINHVILDIISPEINKNQGRNKQEKTVNYAYLTGYLDALSWVIDFSSFKLRTHKEIQGLYTQRFDKQNIRPKCPT